MKVCRIYNYKYYYIVIININNLILIYFLINLPEFPWFSKIGGGSCPPLPPCLVRLCSHRDVAIGCVCGGGCNTPIIQTLVKVGQNGSLAYLRRKIFNLLMLVRKIFLDYAYVSPETFFDLPPPPPPRRQHLTWSKS